MKRTKFDLLLTNAVNILLFIGVFMFGYWRWQKLENIIIESTNSQEQYRIIHAALKSTIQLDHLGEQVSEWSPTDSVDYQQKLVETNNSLDGLRKYYSKSQIDSMQNVLNQKGHLLSEDLRDNRKAE
jgi:hypothetical protein